MHYNVSYKGQPDRVAVLDYVKWLGFRKARLMHQVARTMECKQFNFYSAFAGVTGTPVVKAWERWTGKPFTYPDD